MIASHSYIPFCISLRSSYNPYWYYSSFWYNLLIYLVTFQKLDTGDQTIRDSMEKILTKLTHIMYPIPQKFKFEMRSYLKFCNNYVDIEILLEFSETYFTYLWNFTFLQKTPPGLDDLWGVLQSSYKVQLEPRIKTTRIWTFTL